MTDNCKCSWFAGPPITAVTWHDDDCGVKVGSEGCLSIVPFWVTNGMGTTPWFHVTFEGGRTQDVNSSQATTVRQDQPTPNPRPAAENEE